MGRLAPRFSGANFKFQRQRDQRTGSTRIPRAARGISALPTNPSRSCSSPITQARVEFADIAETLTLAAFGGGGGGGRGGAAKNTATSPEPQDPIKALAMLNEKIKKDPRLGKKHLMIASPPMLFPDASSPKKGLLYSVVILNDAGKLVGSPIWVFSKLSSSTPDDAVQAKDLRATGKGSAGKGPTYN